MNEEQYTVLEIAKEALKKYKVDETEGVLPALKKKIERIIKKNNYEPVSEQKKSIYSKRTAKAYSLEVKNRLVDDLLFDYMIIMSKDELLKEIENSNHYKSAVNSNDRIEHEFSKFLNKTPEEQNVMIENQKSVTCFNENHSFIREKKMEVMLEALFSKYYTLKIDELIDDANKINSLMNDNQAFFDGAELREIARFNNWENYVEEK